MGFLFGIFWSIFFWALSSAYKLFKFVVKWIFHLFHLLAIKLSHKAAKDRMEILSSPGQTIHEVKETKAPNVTKGAGEYIDVASLKERRTGKSMIRNQAEVIYK